MEKLLKVYVVGIFLTLIIGGNLFASIPEKILYVSKVGNDTWSGELASPNFNNTDGPLASIERARDKIREFRKEDGSLPFSVTVQVREGTYRLENTFVLGPEDSGTKDYPITYMVYPGEKVIISGSRKIENTWKKYEDGIYVCTIPEVQEGEWYFRDLFVNGKRQIRAKTPNEGFYFIQDLVKDETNKKSWSSFKYKTGDLKKFRNLTDVELLIIQSWDASRINISEIDDTNNVVKLAMVNHFPFTHWTSKYEVFYNENYAPYTVENVFEGLDSPGEWYLDRHTGELYFWPEEGINIEDLEITAPVLNRLVLMQGEDVPYIMLDSIVRDVDGTMLSEKIPLDTNEFVIDHRYIDIVRADTLRHEPVSYITLSGFTFCETGWPGGWQGAIMDEIEPAAITLSNAHWCTIKNNTITNVGTYGIEILKVGSNNVIDMNEISYTGSGGLRIGEHLIYTKDNYWFGNAYYIPVENRRNTITNNYIHHCGMIHPSGGGILIGCSQQNVIAHNHIHDIAYCGIALRGDTEGNIVEYNHIHDAMQRLCDGGAIYAILFACDGTIIRNNLLHDIPSDKWSKWGIYIDGLVDHVIVMDNIVYRCAWGSYMDNVAGKYHHWINNIFVDATQGQMFWGGRWNQPGYNTFINNIVYYSDPDAYFINCGSENTIMNKMIEMDYNLYYYTEGGPKEMLIDVWSERIGMKDPIERPIQSLYDLQELGFDSHSIIADPLFVDPENDDYRLKPESPAFLLGFRQIDMSTVGPIGWINHDAVEGQYTESNTYEYIETFEGTSLPNWETNGKGSIQTTTYRRKQGQQSLLWNWEPEARIIVADPSLPAISNEKGAGIKFWIYSEVDIGDSIRFDFYNSSDELEFSFHYKINFKGWRALWASFEDDLGRLGRSTLLTRMEINAPAATDSGRLYFDIVEFAHMLDIRSPSRQFAAPHVTKEPYYVEDENQSYVYEQWFPEATLPLPAEVSPEEQNDLALIQTRIDNWLFGTSIYAHDSTFQKRMSALNGFIDEGVNNFAKQKIIRETDGRILGPGLFANSSDHDPKFGMHFAQNLMIPLTLDYHLNGNEESKDNLFLLFDYFYDQGWAEGSAIGAMDHEKLYMVGWMYAIYLMRDELKQESWENGKTKFDREFATMKWMVALNAIFAPPEFDMEINMDDWRSTTLFRLLNIMVMDNTDPQKVQYMRHYQQWLDRNLKLNQGWVDGIKHDGTGYHQHLAYMSAYSNNAVHTMTEIAYWLRHTDFDMNRESKQNLKHYLMNYRIITNLYDVPKGVSGRFDGFNKASNMISPYAYLAKSMDTALTDTALARAMMRLWNPTYKLVDDQIKKVSSNITFNHSPGEIEAILDVVNEGFTPESSPRGLWNKPYASMAVFRNNDWLVTVKGHSAYVYDFEMQSNENDFGRYDSYGQMEIINNLTPYPSTKLSGNDFNRGWDWSKVPGTTTIDYSNEELDNGIHRNFSPNTTVGGVMHRNKNGVWGMEFEDLHYNSGLRFKKSVFFFGDDQMVCLGSDITSSDPSRTVSTLYQHVVSTSNSVFSVNGKEVGNDFIFSPTGGKTRILNDNGLEFIIPDNSNLKIMRKKQDSKSISGKKNTSGDVFTAWFDNSLKNSYEYVVMMEADNIKPNTLINSPEYQIIEQSTKAHVVTYIPDDVTGYVIFDTSAVFDTGYIKSSSQPVFCIIERNSLEEFVLSICDPDFQRPPLSTNTFAALQGPYPESTVKITLDGTWTLKGEYDYAGILTTSEEQTVIEFTCSDAQSYEVMLESNQPPSPERHSLLFKIYEAKEDTIQPGFKSEVIIGEKWLKTDSLGNTVEVQSLSGTLSYSLKKKGFKSKVREIQINTDTIITDTLFEDRYTVKVEVKNSVTDKLIKNCEIKVNDEDWSMLPEGVLELQDILYGIFDFQLKAPTYAPLTYTDIEVFSDTTLVFILEQKVVSVSFSVFDKSSGLPVNRVIIQSEYQENLTNSSGLATLNQVMPGKSKFTFQHQNYFTHIDSFYILQDTGLNLYLTNEFANVDFLITDSNTPLEGASISVGGMKLITDDEGRVYFYNQKARHEYHLQIEKNGYKTYVDTFFLELDTGIVYNLDISSNINFNKNLSILVFPNPAKEKLILILPYNEGSIEILNISGSVLMSQEIFNKHEKLDITSLENGYYILKIDIGGTHHFTRFVKY
ncbi:chondroitinase family polysaccharide lyase [Bacteroidota bacterium]